MEDCCLASADGDMLLVPQQGACNCCKWFCFKLVYLQLRQLT
jgi:homogentisate 1,2-dioxygenase